MKEKVQEFDIDIRFHFDSSMVIEATTEQEALKIAQKHYMDIIRDHLRDRSNLNIKVKSKHVITEEERAKLEADGIIEPRKLTARQRAKLEKQKAYKAFSDRMNEEVKRRRNKK